MTPSGGSDIRGETNLLSKVDAIKLALAYRELGGGYKRLLAIVDWLLEGEEPRSGDTSSPALLIAAIRATDGRGATQG